MLRSALLGAAVLSFFVAVFAGCGGGSNNSNPPLSPAQNMVTETLAAPGTPNSIPAVGGYSGSFTLAANDAPAGTNVMLTSYTVTPGGAPAAQSLVSPTVLFWVSHVYSQTATFDAFPITSWQLAATPGTGANIFLETRWKYSARHRTSNERERTERQLPGRAKDVPGSGQSHVLVGTHKRIGVHARHAAAVNTGTISDLKRAGGATKRKTRVHHEAAIRHAIAKHAK
ncbi:MAG: hypothetical protein ACXVA3_15785 [Vulcanimicrobiaceae bacterium]